MSETEVKRVINIDGTVYALVPLSLLKEAHSVLGQYWFAADADGYGEQNNDDVIAVSEALEPWMEFKP
jgi:hypothetical protein